MKRDFVAFSLVTLILSAALWGAPDIIPLGPFGGDVRSLALHPLRPDRLFLGTADGQIFVSEDKGNHWSKLSPGLNRRELVIDSLTFDPQNPDTLFAGGWELKSDRGALFRTRNGGNDWEEIDLGDFQSSLRAIAVSSINPQLVAVGVNEGVLLSRNGGDSWERITRGYRSLYNVHSLVFHPTEEETLYVGTWRLAWKTENLGKAWKPIHTGMYWDSDVFSIQVNPARPDTVFAGACSGFYRSLEGGDAWSKLKNGIPDAAKRTRVVRVDPDSPNTVFAGTTAGLYKSDDLGESWRCQLPGVVINSIVIDPTDSRRMFLGTDDVGVLVSENRGADFRSSNEGFSHRQISSVAVGGPKEETLYAAVVMDSSHGGFFVSSDNGNSWRSFNKGLGDAAPSIQAILASSSRLLVATTQGLFSSETDSPEWKQVKGTAGLELKDMAFSSGSRDIVFAVGKAGIYRVDFQSGKCEKLSISVYKGEVHSVLTERGHVFVGTEMGVFRSDDSGKTWEVKVEGLPYAVVGALKVGRERLFCATTVGLFYSDDLGEHWNRASGVFPIEIGSIESSPGEGTEMYASDPVVGYFFVSVDNGSNWEALDLGRELSRISSLHVTGTGRILAGTVAEGVVQIVPAKDEMAVKAARSSE